MAGTDLFIVRHGETESNRLNRIQGRSIDEPLNQTGRLQALAIAEFLQNYTIDLAISSSLARSKETAGIVAEQFGINVLSYVELDEMNFGVIEGKCTKEIQLELKTLHERWEKGETGFALQDGESPKAVLERVQSRMISIIEEHADKNIFIVLHGRLIRILLSYWLGYGLERMHEIEHCNGSLNHLRWNGKAFKIVCLHKTDHLQEFVEKNLDTGF